MKIYTYAVLKDYFDKEFNIEEPVDTVQGLHNLLTRRNPDAATVLAACRYAVKDQFVPTEYTLDKNDSVHIIPPSSGG